MLSTVSCYEEMLAFECQSRWQDPPVFAILVLDGHAVHFRCAAPPLLAFGSNLWLRPLIAGTIDSLQSGFHVSLARDQIQRYGGFQFGDLIRR